MFVCFSVTELRNALILFDLLMYRPARPSSVGQHHLYIIFSHHFSIKSFISCQSYIHFFPIYVFVTGKQLVG